MEVSSNDKFFGISFCTLVLLSLSKAALWNTWIPIVNTVYSNFEIICFSRITEQMLI